MFLSDLDYLTVVEKISKLSRQNLSITVESLINQPKSPFIHDPVLFTQKFRAEFPNSTLLKSFNINSFSARADFDPKNYYYSGNVCYVIAENKTSSGKGYEVQKKNTYSLCPLCDPFAKIGLHQGTHRYKRVQGENLETDQREPVFYDTLHSQYSHHMGQCHGIFKDKTFAETPFLGFTKQKLSPTSKGGYELACICPYSQGDANGNIKPCLEVVKANSNAKDGNCFKAYFRHVDSCHKHGASTGTSKIKYTNHLPETQQANNFIPLNMKAFENSLFFLQSQCQDYSISPIVVSQDPRIVEFLNVLSTEIDNVSANSIATPLTSSQPLFESNDYQLSQYDSSIITDIQSNFELDLQPFDAFKELENLNSILNLDQYGQPFQTYHQPDNEILDACPELEKDNDQFEDLNSMELDKIELSDFEIQGIGLDEAQDTDDDFINQISTFNDEDLDEQFYTIVGNALETFNCE